MGTSIDVRYNDNPGPGSYMPKYVSIDLSASKQGKLGKSPRKDIFEDEIRRSRQQPSGADYKLRGLEDNSNQAFAFTSKRDEKYNNNPGPG